METHTTEQLLKAIAAETGVDASEIHPETVLSSLVTDSLELASLAIVLRDDFGFEVDISTRFKDLIPQ